MNSPGNGYPQRGMFSTPSNSMFPHVQQSPRLSSNGIYSPIYPSQHKYSPINPPQGRYSPTNSQHNYFSPQDGYSARNQFKGGYSPRNSSQNSSFGGYTSTRSASPLHQQALRQSFNNSRDASSVSSRSSLDSTDNNQRFKPYVQNNRLPFNQSRDASSTSSRSSLDSSNYNQQFKPNFLNKRNKQNRNSWNSNKNYNIEDYVLPSMLEDPWAGLKK